VQEKIITLYCLCADFLIAYGHRDDVQTQMTTAEVMTVALVAAEFFGGNQERSRIFLQEHGYMPQRLSKSRLNRRLHAISDTLWQALFALLAEVAKQSNPTQEYIVDSCPVPVCDNIRIFRSRIYHGEAFRGRVASKKRFVYGLRIHLMISATGKPVEFVLAPASTADVTAFRTLPLDLPEGAEVYADPAYTDYSLEDLLHEMAGITLTVPRKKNSKRPHPGWVTFICERTRKRVETTFSQITNRLARSIHAVTPRGFELKVFLTVLAFTILG
jgi:transposase